MMMLFFLGFLISASFGEVLRPVLHEYQYQEALEFKAILATLKPYGEFSREEAVPVKTMSRGEQMVEEAKARNRAILAQQKTEEKLSGPDLWRQEMKKSQALWQNEMMEYKRQWQRDQAIFLGRLKVYQDNTFVLPAKMDKIREEKLLSSEIPDAHIINGTFKIPVRDQEGRPTCSAFAGIRALEIILVQNEREKDLSEQYLYWASKPNCHELPCAEKGSWITHALRFSQKQTHIDIPVEGSCAYRPESVSQNETQIPLEKSCQEGVTKIQTFEEVRSLAQVVEKVKQDAPVIMAAKLSENFYKNQGLVTLKDSLASSPPKLDGHAMGHAFLAVGVIELPEKLKASEGNFCLVVANSWGRGWGAGGYACLTENWLLKYRQPSPFIAVTEIRLR